MTLSIRFMIFSRSHKLWISRLFTFFFLFLLLMGCDTKNGVDRDAVKKEMANRELKRLRNSDILQRGEEIGKAYFKIKDIDRLSALVDSLKLEVSEVLSPETEEEDQLLEAFIYASENNQDLEDYLSDNAENVFFYHPEVVADSLLITRLTISKKAIVKSL